jgi:hypothetical protein
MIIWLWGMRIRLPQSDKAPAHDSAKIDKNKQAKLGHENILTRRLSCNLPMPIGIFALGICSKRIGVIFNFRAEATPFYKGRDAIFRDNSCGDASSIPQEEVSSR